MTLTIVAIGGVVTTVENDGTATTGGSRGMAQDRAEKRRQSNPQGPIGYLLETAHIQASCMDMKYRIRQWNQPMIDVLKSPYQHLRPLVRQAAARNRTLVAEGTRHENVGLKEIDAFATQADEKRMDQKDLTLLNVIRTGSMWTQSTTSWTGKVDDTLCELCGLFKETPEHVL